VTISANVSGQCPPPPSFDTSRMGNGGEGAFSLGFKIAQWMEPCEDATRLVALGIVVLERRLARSDFRELVAGAREQRPVQPRIGQIERKP
jgi:hypothetical protein